MCPLRTGSHHRLCERYLSADDVLKPTPPGRHVSLNRGRRRIRHPRFERPTCDRSPKQQTWQGWSRAHSVGMMFSWRLRGWHRVVQG